MDIYDVYSSIITKLRNDWNLTVDIDYPNVTTQPSTPYIRPVFLPLGNARKEIGLHGSDKLDVILSIDIFTKVGNGIGESVELMQHIMDLFPAGSQITSDKGTIITFKTPVPLAGKDGENGLWMITVHCPWYCFKY